MTTSNFLAGSDLTDVFPGPIQVFAGDTDVSTKAEVMTGGTAAQVPGAVLARTTASGKLVPWNPAGAAGAQLAIGVLVNACDASGGTDTPCNIYASGCFNTAYLGWNGATAAQQAAAFDNTKLSHKPLNWSQG